MVCRWCCMFRENNFIVFCSPHFNIIQTSEWIRKPFVENHYFLDIKYLHQNTKDLIRLRFLNEKGFGGEFNLCRLNVNRFDCLRHTQRLSKIKTDCVKTTVLSSDLFSRGKPNYTFYRNEKMKFLLPSSQNECDSFEAICLIQNPKLIASVKHIKQYTVGNGSLVSMIFPVERFKLKVEWNQKSELNVFFFSHENFRLPIPKPAVINGRITASIYLSIGIQSMFWHLAQFACGIMSKASFDVVWLVNVKVTFLLVR